MSTPMLRQYRALKERYPDTIIFYRLGDFYEMFFEDAEIASRLLNLTFTGRGQGENRIPMCGFPHHAANTYIPKLLAAGLKVAVAEQTEDPALAKDGPSGRTNSWPRAKPASSRRWRVNGAGGRRRASTSPAAASRSGPTCPPRR